jgi:hypothetical protein
MTSSIAASCPPTSRPPEARPRPPSKPVKPSLLQQLPKILEKQKCQNVRLEVAVEEGKVLLRAWPAERKG